jgi:hypothetical protein
MDPIPIGVVPLQLDKLFSTQVEKKDVDAFFDPRRDFVYLQFRVQGIVYRQHWSGENRQKFINALDEYKKAYVEKNLPTKGLKGIRAERAFGMADGFTEWGQTGLAGALMNAKSYPLLEFGYKFKKESPYFIVIMRSARDITTSGDVYKNESLEITTYYTRAQADALVALFDQQYLLSFLGAKADPNYSQPDVEPDDDGYTEAEPSAPAAKPAAKEKPDTTPEVESAP